MWVLVQVIEWSLWIQGLVVQVYVVCLCCVYLGVSFVKIVVKFEKCFLLVVMVSGVVVGMVVILLGIGILVVWFVVVGEVVVFFEVIVLFVLVLVLVYVIFFDY